MTPTTPTTLTTRMSPMSPEETLVIVGNGMATHTLCRTLMQAPAAARPRLVVVGDEPRPAYNRVRLSELMSGLPPEQLELSPREFYADNDITLHCGEEVTRIDRDASEVVTASGQRIAYDRLVLATGSYAIRPPIVGIDDPSCFVYRAEADLVALREASKGKRHGVVIGGGLLGLEAVKVLSDRGLSVTVVEAADGLMARQLDLESAGCLRERVEALGVEVYTRAQVRAIERDGAQLRVRLSFGHLAEAPEEARDHELDLPADVIVIAAGVRPRDSLAVDAGLACGVRGGVIVDDALTTSDPKVHAIGECASYQGQIFGLVRPCQDMARVLARRFLGAEARFERPDLSCQLKLLGIPVAALGDYGNEHRLVGVKVGEGRRTLLLESGRLVGAVVVGSWNELPRVEEALTYGQKLSHRAVTRFERTGTLFGDRAPLPVVAWPSDAIVCNCAHVSAGELRERIDAGVCDLAALSACTGAALGCGSCTPLVGALLGDARLSQARVRTYGLLGVSLAACVLALGILALPPPAFADSVADGFRAVDRFWREISPKRVSGFVILGLLVAALFLSVRKRGHWPKLGPLNVYRTLHAVIGCGALVALVAHTGFRLGENLNLALMTSFLALNVLGAVVGVASTLETKHGRPTAVFARKLRPVLTLLHILLVWPLPVLLGLHVLATYYF